MTSSEEQQPRDSHEGLSEDPIVGRLVPDPSQPPPPTVALEGLLGKSIREGYRRLYFSSGLERYAEFKEEDVLHSEKIPQEQLPFAGLQATKVWLRHDAEVEYTHAESRRVQAEFLGGNISSAFLPTANLEPVAITPITTITPWTPGITITIGYSVARCTHEICGDPDIPGDVPYSGALLCTLPGYPGCKASGVSRFCQPE